MKLLGERELESRLEFAQGKNAKPSPPTKELLGKRE